MRVLDLFSGIGGFSLGLERAGMKTVAFCEIEPYCQAVLRKHWPDVPIYSDIRELDGRTISADVVCGGFPCQPFSVAGKQRGKEDDRHLWPEMRRVIEQARPAWVIGENVAGIIRMELDTVLSDLETLGYTTRTFVIPAVAVDAPHRRDRIWAIGYSNSRRKPDDAKHDETPIMSDVAITNSNRRKSIQGGRPVPDEQRNGAREDEGWENEQQRIGSASDVADANGAQRKGRRVSGGTHQEHTNIGGGCWWNPEPCVGRVAHGVPSRMDRLRCLGNAVVPQVVEQIGKAIMRSL